MKIKYLIAVLIVLAGAVLAGGILFFPNLFFYKSISIAQISPRWTESAGDAISAPACNSATATASCSDGNAQVNLSWTDSGQHETCTYTDVTLGSKSASGWACTDSSQNHNEFINLLSNTTYNWKINWANASSIVDTATGTVATPNCNTGTLRLRGKLDGAPWSGKVVVDHTRPDGTVAQQSYTLPYNNSNATVGTHTFIYKSGGPSGAIFASTTPSQTQTLSVGGDITFKFNFLSFDYNLSNSGDITVNQGKSGSNTISATLLTSNTNSVSFAAFDFSNLPFFRLPAGTSASFNPGSCNPTCDSTLTISTSASTPVGTYPITVVGSPLGKTTTFNLVVNSAPPGNFTLNPPSAACNSVSLSWTASAGADGYRILKGSARVDITPYQPYTALNYIDYAVSQNTDYLYQIEAYNSVGTNRSNARNVTTPYCPPTLNFSGDPTTVYEGQKSTLQWSSTNATSCNASGAWSGSKAVNGSEVVIPLPPPSVTYTLTCAGPGGSSGPKSVTINITPLGLPNWKEIIPR